MKTALKAGIVLLFAIAALFIILEADDSDAADITCQYRVVEDGICYDLCYDPDQRYGYEYVAFTTDSGHDNTNSNYDHHTVYIASHIVRNNTTYTVVGICNNSFMASKATVSSGGCIHIEKVSFPETLKVIGVSVGKKYLPADSSGGYCFSGCRHLTEVEFRYNQDDPSSYPKLQKICQGAFKECAIEELDLSMCEDLDTIYGEAFLKVYKLKTLDIRHATEIKADAFPNSDKIQNLIMPTSGTIASNAFGGVQFYGDDPNTPLSPAELIGKAFKLENGKMKAGYVAAYNVHGGHHIEEQVLFPGEQLPTGVKDGYGFYGWKDSNGTMVSVMPDVNSVFTAVWSVEIPVSITHTYNGHNQWAHEDTDGYYVTGDSHMKVGSYECTLTLNENFVWSDGSSAPLVKTWTIEKAILKAEYISERVLIGNSPHLKVVVTGFVGGESEDTAAGYKAPYVLSTNLPTETGYYTLTPMGGAADNYEFEYVSGTLHIKHGIEEGEYVVLGTFGAITVLALLMLVGHVFIRKP